MDGNLGACEVVELLCNFRVCHGELEVLGLDGALGVFVAVAGEDNLSFVGFPNVTRIGEGIQFTGFGAVTEHPEEFEIEEACEGCYNKESYKTSYSFASVSHFVIFVFTKIAFFLVSSRTLKL